MLKAVSYFALVFCFCIAAAEAPAGARNTVTLIEVRKDVSIQRVGGTNQVAAKVGDVLHVGDTIRTGEDSWVAIQLSELSVIRKGPLSTVIVQPPVTGGEPVLDVKAGLMYFFGRDRTDPVRVRTPKAAGAIRGTDFSLEVKENGETVITMIDGAVDLSAGGQTITLTNSMQAQVDDGGLKTRVISKEEERQVIQWALFYPAVLDLKDLNGSLGANLNPSLEAYGRGDLKKALETLPSNYEPKTGAERTYVAAVLIGNGSLEHGLQLAGDAPALKRLVEAIRSAAPGTLAEAKPATATELMVESYVAQAQGKLGLALEHARAAAKASPDFGFAWARVGELEFSFGHTDATSDALQKAISFTPDFAPAHVLKGFTLAARMKWGEAEASFNRALELDRAIGNAWLGRGLVKMRRGQVVAGREDLQTAALMEPQRGILRSYLGKAHFETANSTNALRELNLAIRLEPGDPTAWLYLAILEQQENRLNEGIADLEESKRLNDNRALFRSRLLLDQDQAVRSANLAAMYRDAGLSEVSVREAGRAVNYDYGNGSAHLFLAESYDALRDPNQHDLRYETAWENEMLLANLLSPVGAESLSQTVSQQEYSRLFARDGVGFSAGTRFQSFGEIQQYASLYGNYGGMSYALDAFYHSKDDNNFPNTDVERRAYSGKFKQQLTEKDSLFFEAIYYRIDSGVAAQLYDPKTASQSFRFKEWQEPTVFAGYHRAWSPEHHTLFMAASLNDEVQYSLTNTSMLMRQRDDLTGAIIAGIPLRPFGQTYAREFSIWSGEAQHIWTPLNHQFIVGGRFQHGEIDTDAGLFRDDVVLGFPFLGLTNGVVQSNQTEMTRGNVYGYWHWQVWEPLRLIGGASYDYLKFPENLDFIPISDGERVKEKVSPKAGFILNPIERTWLRGSYTRSLGGLSFDNNARLEPAQLAGFTQGFRSALPESEFASIPGAAFETFALGIDHRFPTRTYVGIEGEMLFSDSDRTIGVLDYRGPPALAGQQREQFDFKEKTFAASVHQLMGEQFSAGATYRISEAKYTLHFPNLPLISDIHGEGTLQELKLFTIWNNPHGFFAQMDGVWTHQSNQGYNGSDRRPGDSFWQANAWTGYRLPRNRAEFRLGILNIFDQDYHLSPLNLHSAPPRDRTLAVELKLNF